MHYIRFLKAPRLVRGSRGQKTLNAKITITTDLGESFLAADVGVEVFLEDLQRSVLLASKPISYSWLGRNGMRALGISVPVPRSHAGGLKMCVRPIEARYSVGSFGGIFDSSPRHAGIVAVYSTALDVSSNSVNEPLAERRFETNTGSIRIWEETGESIARHIWYAYSRYVFLPH